MKTLQIISKQNLDAWEQQGKAAKQWLGSFTGQFDWLAAYTSSPNRSVDWIDTSHVSLRDMPLLGQCLADITESPMQQQSETEVGIKSSSISDGFKKYKRSKDTKQSVKKSRQSSLTKPGLQAEHVEPVESVSRVKRNPSRVNYTVLRQWCNTQYSDPSSSTETVDSDLSSRLKTVDPDLSSRLKTVDKEVSGRSLPEFIHTKKQLAVSNSNAVRQTPTKDQKKWSNYALRRVNKILNRENGSVNDRGVSETVKKKHFKEIKRGLLLPEQWQSVLQDQYISHELLMNIVAKNKRAPVTRSKKTEHGIVMHKVSDNTDKKTLQQFQRSENRQQKSTPVTDGEAQANQTELKRETPVQSKQHSLKTVDNQTTEDLLAETETNPAKILQNDEELAMQIKRILNEEARRYGIDV